MPRSFSSATRALVMAGLAILLLPLMTAHSAEPPAEISIADSIVRYASTSTMSLEVRYQCTNTPGPDGVVHWITALLEQPDKANYTAGIRNDSVVMNITQATCTGAMVTQRLTLSRSGNAAASVPDPETGPASVTVQLERRATADRGGWLTYKGIGAEVIQTVFVACNGPYTDGRCHQPRTVPTRINAVARRVVYTSPRTMRTWVTYTCQNLPGPLGRVHYLIVGFQKGRPGTTVHYSVGTRGEGPILQAVCTGKPVQHFLRLTGYFFPPGVRNPRPGRGTLSVSLSPRGTQDMGGWYVSTGPDARWRGSARLVCLPRSSGLTMPAVCRRR